MPPKSKDNSQQGEPTVPPKSDGPNVPPACPADQSQTPSIKPMERDVNGLVVGLKYEYKDNGLIDWEKMFNPEYCVYPNGDFSKPPLLKVDGLRELAEIRGVESKEVDFQVVGEMVVCRVTVKYIPNKENPNGRVWSAMADACSGNIGGNFKKYLSAMAETRATGRCHKEALGIRLCTFEECDENDIKDPSQGTAPVTDVILAAIKRQLEIKKIPESEMVQKIQAKYPEITALAQLTCGQGLLLLRSLNEKQNPKMEAPADAATPSPEPAKS